MADERKVEELLSRFDLPVNANIYYSDNPEKIRQAAEELAHIGGVRAVEALIGVLGRADTEEENDCAREMAAWALGEIRDTRAIGPLCEALSSEWHGMREKAARALGRIGDRRSEACLWIALEKEGDYCAKRELVKALGRVSGEVGLKKALEHEDNNVRYFAGEELKKLLAAPSAK